MMRFQVTLKSGAQIEFEAIKLTTTNRTGTLVEMEWSENEGTAPSLHFVNLAEVAAVVKIK